MSRPPSANHWRISSTSRRRYPGSAIGAVLSEGEYSLLYFGGDLSHAIVKRPKAGDFRVQEEHGGHIEAITPDVALRAAGRAVIDALEEPLLQARVDLVRLDDG